MNQDNLNKNAFEKRVALHLLRVIQENPETHIDEISTEIENAITEQYGYSVHRTYTDRKENANG